MPEIKNTFLKGKMNKSLDDRLLPEGEYRDAVNVQITKSDTSDVGTAHNVKGNTAVGSIGLGSDYEVVGSFFDNQYNRIFYFLTNNTAHKIYVYNVNTETSSLLVNGDSFLNFSKDNLITGINLVDDFLFFSDNVNQPRRINVTKAIAGTTNYNSEAKVSVAKYSPYYAPTMVISHDTSVSSEYMKDKFLRFAYRYKFEDNEYSVISPFTEVAFSIGVEGTASNKMTSTEIADAFETTVNNKVINRINKVVLTVPEPSAAPLTDLGIVRIDFLLKESDSPAIRLIESKNIDDSSWGSDQFVFEYKGELPTSTLSEEQAIRVFDKVPKKSQAQEFAGNRLIYGNNTHGFDLPDIDYTAFISSRVDDSTSSFNGQLSLKQRRSYKVGIVLSDYYGRSTSVILSSTNSSTVECLAKKSSFDSTSWVGDNLQILFNENVSTTTTQATASASTASVNVTLASGGNLANIKVGQKVTGTGISGYVQVKSISNTALVLTSPQTIGSSVTLTFTNQTIANAYDSTNNPLGFFSYKVVVQQKEQEYYNVYAPGVMNVSFDGTGPDYLTLHGDNINKVPRDTTNTVDNDNTSPSATRLFPKIINKNDSITGNTPGDGLSQLDGDLITIKSIGALSAHGFTNSGNLGDNTYKFFEHEKNHLVAKLDTSSSPIGSVVFNFTDQLAVFETEPFESVLDIYYETPTSGLVSDLNSTSGELVVDTVTVTSEGAASNSSATAINFPESIASGTSLANIIVKDGSVVVPTAVVTLQSATCGGIDVSSKFTVFFDNIDNVYKVKTSTNFTHVSSFTAIADGSSSGSSDIDIDSDNSLIQIGQAIASSGGASYGIVTAKDSLTISRSGSGSINNNDVITFTGQNDYILTFRSTFNGATNDQAITFTLTNVEANITGLDDFSIVKTTADATTVGTVTGDNGDAGATTDSLVFSLLEVRSGEFGTMADDGAALDHNDAFTINASGVVITEDSSGELGSYSASDQIALTFVATDNSSASSVITTQAVASSNAHTAGELIVTLAASNAAIEVGQLVVGANVPAGVTVGAISGTTLTLTTGRPTLQIPNSTTLNFTTVSAQTVVTILDSSASTHTVQYNSNSSAYSTSAQACLGVVNGEFTDTVTLHYTEGGADSALATNTTKQIFKDASLSKLANAGWYSDGSSTGLWGNQGSFPNATGYWAIAPTDCST